MPSRASSRRRASGSSALVLVTSLMIAGTATAAMTIDDPARAQCPRAALVERAVATHLGGGAAAGDEGWHLAYRARGDGIELELRDQRGGLHLHRQVAGGGGDCQALAEAIALIVDRFFEDLGWTSGRPLPAPAENVATTAGAPARPVLAVSVEGGGGVWTRRQNIATGVAGVRIARGLFEGALHVLGPGADDRQPITTAGAAALTTWGLALSAAVGRQKDRTRLRVGPVGLVSLEWAHSQGIPVTKQTSGRTVALGLHAGGAWTLSPHWALDVEGWGTRQVAGDRFVVTGVMGPVLAPPRFQAAAFLAVAYVF
jgi:hypothetical protein